MSIPPFYEPVVFSCSDYYIINGDRNRDKVTKSRGAVDSGVFCDVKVNVSHRG
jgi:hypothetical protein